LFYCAFRGANIGFFFLNKSIAFEKYLLPVEDQAIIGYSKFTGTQEYPFFPLNIEHCGAVWQRSTGLLLAFLLTHESQRQQRFATKRQQRTINKSGVFFLPGGFH
jgi:hypothetical protein